MNIKDSGDFAHMGRFARQSQLGDYSMQLFKSKSCKNGCLVVTIQVYDNLLHLSYDVLSGSEITPCNKIDKPLVVFGFSGNVMTSITTLGTE